MRRTLDGNRPTATALTAGDLAVQNSSAEGAQSHLPSSSPLLRGSVENGLPEWPPPLAQLVSNAWAQLPSERPTIVSMAKIFAEQIQPLLIAAGDHWADVKAQEISGI